ncbi:MAG TPA: AmmeMemoRadiSam system radical SAM enzyme [Clostridia bacterium]|nr:AmmeMemoRadiSam system radical SAM enzyme [Clostridia bacterium]
MKKKQAMFYEKAADKVRCKLCPHNCLIENGNSGKCGVRVNDGGELYTINYGEVTALALDPIEKKPLYYFRSGTYILSVSTFGCNLHCGFCQNYHLFQQAAEREYISPDGLVEMILETPESVGIAFTYNEPTIWFEYVYDSAMLLKEKDPSKAVVLVTNGYISKEPLEMLLPYVDAMNIDLKSINNAFYKDICGGSINPVKRTIEAAARACHVEITTLLVTGENDTVEEVESIAEYISSIDKDIPLHISRYFPRFNFKNPPTDIQLMKKAAEAAGKHLNRVHLGNV